MPHTYTRTFRVRYYECDAYGHLNSINYLRYMQETAFDASADAGYDLQRYEAMNRYWLVHETTIEYLLPLYYNQEVEVKTWIADFRRASSRRAYEFRLAQTNNLCARAFTDWVFLDATTQQPTGIPDTLINDFYPEGKPGVFPRRQPFPILPEPPAEVFSIRRRVSWQDIDSMRHINNAVYMTYASECGFQAIAAFGWPLERMIQTGFAIVIRRCQIQYLQSGLLDEELEISTWASDVRRSMASRHYTICRLNDGALLSRVNMFSVWVDLKTGKPVRIPQQFLNDFAANITSKIFTADGRDKHSYLRI
jgi:acyl-CoA thioester hydrolase